MKYRRLVLATLAITASVLFIQAVLAKKKLKQQLLPTVAEIEIQQPEWTNFVVLGDSLAVGLGADCYQDTPGVRLQHMLADYMGAGVNYFNFGNSGATSYDLPEQANFAVQVQPDIVLIVIGTNDCKGGRNLARTPKSLKACIDKLSQTGAEIYLVPCVDLSVVKSIPVPLRHVLGVISRNYAKVQTKVAKAAGAHVITSESIGYSFEKDINLFAKDKFHPSSGGYKLIVEHIFKEMT